MDPNSVLTLHDGIGFAFLFAFITIMHGGGSFHEVYVKCYAFYPLGSVPIDAGGGFLAICFSVPNAFCRFFAFRQ